MSSVSKFWSFLRNNYHIPILSKIGPISYLFYGYRIEEKPYIIDSINNLSYNRYTHIGNETFNGRKFEERELLFLTQILSKDLNPILIDIGANIGIHTIYLSKNNPALKALSFEPSPKIFKRLAFNIKLNNLQNRVQLFNMALSDKPGLADFFETTDDAFSSLKNTGRMAVTAMSKVKVVCLDDLEEINKLPNITLVKIDVEGFDDEVINGALKTLQKFKPDVFIEIYKGENSNLNPEITITKLIALGYTAYVFNEGGDLTAFEKHDDRLQNYLFTFKKMVQ